MPKFKNLYWKKRCGNEGGEVFGPDLFEHEANAFDKAERGVTEEEDADSAQHVVVDEIGFFEQEPDESSFGVHAEIVGNILEDVGEVLAYQAQGSEADAHEQGCLEELVDGDQFQPPIAFFVTS